jgi:hypothetical protein
MPLASNLNYLAGQTVPNAVIAPVSATGTVCFYSLRQADIVVDINGWFRAGGGLRRSDHSGSSTLSGHEQYGARVGPATKLMAGEEMQLQLSDLGPSIPSSGWQRSR